MKANRNKGTVKLYIMKSWPLFFSLILAAQAQAPVPATGSRELNVTVGKAVLVDSPTVIERVAVANPALVEAVVINPREVMVNGKIPGQTSLIIWQQGGVRQFFDLSVLRSEERIDGLRRQLATELGQDTVQVETQDDAIFLRGTVPDLTSADRAMTIASALGKPVNLMKVTVPPTDAQILLKVKFADVDRSAAIQLGINFFSTGAAGNIGTISTGQFPPPVVTSGQGGAPGSTGTTFSVSQALNVFLFRPDLNLGATVAALQARNLLQILAEPNVLAMNGKPASFLAGGEFPFPTLQGGASVGAVTIQFREFGVRINVTPLVTPRGTIQLIVSPEVSSLDFANGLVFQGFTVPALSTRRVSTEIELEDGQSFAIGGLLDNRITESLDKIPGLGDIPFFGRLFRSRQTTRNNTELLVMVTPEIVRPIPHNKPLPSLNMPNEFMEPNTSSNPPRTPGIEVTGTVPLSSPPKAIPVEQLVQSMTPPQAQGTPIQYVPVPIISVPQSQTQPQSPTGPPTQMPPQNPAPGVK